MVNAKALPDIRKGFPHTNINNTNNNAMAKHLLVSGCKYRANHLAVQSPFVSIFQRIRSPFFGIEPLWIHGGFTVEANPAHRNRRYFTSNASVCVSRLFGPIITSKTQGSHTYSRA